MSNYSLCRMNLQSADRWLVPGREVMLGSRNKRCLSYLQLNLKPTLWSTRALLSGLWLTPHGTPVNPALTFFEKNSQMKINFQELKIKYTFLDSLKILEIFIPSPHYPKGFKVLTTLPLQFWSLLHFRLQWSTAVHKLAPNKTTCTAQKGIEP